MMQQRIPIVECGVSWRSRIRIACLMYYGFLMGTQYGLVSACVSEVETITGLVDDQISRIMFVPGVLAAFSLKGGNLLVHKYGSAKVAVLSAFSMMLGFPLLIYFKSWFLVIPFFLIFAGIANLEMLVGLQGNSCEAEAGGKSVLGMLFTLSGMGVISSSWGVSYLFDNDYDPERILWIFFLVAMCCNVITWPCLIHKDLEDILQKLQLSEDISDNDDDDDNDVDIAMDMDIPVRNPLKLAQLREVGDGDNDGGRGDNNNNNNSISKAKTKTKTKMQLVFVSLNFGFLMVAFSCSNLYTILFLEETENSSKTNASLGVSMFEGAGLVSTILVDYIFDHKLISLTQIMVGLSAISAFGACLVFSSGSGSGGIGPYGSHSNNNSNTSTSSTSTSTSTDTDTDGGDGGGELFGLAITGFALMGFGIAGMCPVLYSAAGTIDGIDVNDAFALVSFMGFLGSGLAPGITSLLVDSSGLENVWILCICICTFVSINSTLWTRLGGKDFSLQLQSQLCHNQENQGNQGQGQRTGIGQRDGPGYGQRDGTQGQGGRGKEGISYEMLPTDTDTDTDTDGGSIGLVDVDGTAALGI